MKRVLLLNNLPAPYFVPLFRRLDEVADWRLTICYATEWKSDLGWPEELTKEGKAPRTIYLDQTKTSAWLPAGLSGGTVGTVLRMLTVLRRERPDYLICYGYTPLLSAMLTGVSFALIGDANIYCDQARGLRRMAKRFWLQLLTRKAAAIMTIGRANRRFWQSYGARDERLFPVPFTVDNGYFAQQAEARRSEAVARRDLLGLTGRIVFLYVGRLVARKNIDLLIDSIHQLDEERMALVIVGLGPERGALERRAAGDRRIHFAGGVTPDELPLYYAMSDVLVLVARDEPWGLVINEAMASGLAIIAHRHCGATSDLVSNANGIVLESHTSGELADAMRRLADNPRHRIADWSIEATVAGIVSAVEASDQQPPQEERR
jgi:glycosyltransferase involved in cell wall biosynthesis